MITKLITIQRYLYSFIEISSALSPEPEPLKLVINSKFETLFRHPITVLCARVFCPSGVRFSPEAMSQSIAHNFHLLYFFQAKESSIFD